MSVSFCNCFFRTLWNNKWNEMKDGHQWNHSETSTPKSMNMQHNEHTHDTRSNSQWKKYKNGTMQIYPITTRGNGTWYWVLNNHEPRARCMHCTHSLQLTVPHGRSLCTYMYSTYMYMYVHVPIIKYIAMCRAGSRQAYKGTAGRPAKLAAKISSPCHA